MLDVGLQHYAGVIEESCVAAGHEHALEQQLEGMERSWRTMSLLVVAWREFYRLDGIENIQQVNVLYLFFSLKTLKHRN